LRNRLDIVRNKRRNLPEDYTVLSSLTWTRRQEKGLKPGKNPDHGKRDETGRERGELRADKRIRDKGRYPASERL